MTSEALSAALLLIVIAFPFALYLIVMHRMFGKVPHLKAARKSARSSNYGRAQKKLFTVYFSRKERNVK